MKEKNESRNTTVSSHSNDINNKKAKILPDKKEEVVIKKVPKLEMGKI